MDFLSAHYRTLADYDALVPPVEVLIKPFERGQLECWYLKEVKKLIYSVVTGGWVGSRAGASGDNFHIPILPPRPVRGGAPRQPPADERGRREPPTARRVSMLNIIRRLRPVGHAVRAARAAYLQRALGHYAHQRSKAADPVAVLADRLKACAGHLLKQREGLENVAKGLVARIMHQRDDLPGGGQYSYPWGWPVARVADLAGEMLLFHKLRADFDAAVQALAPEAPRPLDTPAAPTTIQPLDTLAAFWEALRRMPMEVEWVNDSPRYTVPVHLWLPDGFNEDLRPLREAFEAALPKLKTKHLRLLHHDLSKLLSIDRQSFKRRGALHSEQNYALQFLPVPYPCRVAPVRPAVRQGRLGCNSAAT